MFYLIPNVGTKNIMYKCTYYKILRSFGKPLAGWNN